MKSWTVTIRNLQEDKLVTELNIISDIKLYGFITVKKPHHKVGVG